MFAAVHYAAKGGNAQALDLLLRLRAEVNKQNVTGWTALALAGDRGHVEIAKTLIKAKADVNAKDEVCARERECM